MSATMSIQEGLDILLEVAHTIRKPGRRDVHFTCVGGGPGLAGLRQMVKDKNLGDMVNFTGEFRTRNCSIFSRRRMSASIRTSHAR